MKTPDFKIIPLNEISIGKTNPRSAFDLDSITELSKSIEEKGIIQSLTVRPIHYEVYPGPEKPIWELVCGERRYRASLMLQEQGQEIVGVPCMIRELSDIEVIELQITENLQRKDVHPMDEAVTFKSLIVEHNFSSDEIAKRLGKTVFYVNQRLRLAELIGEFQTAFFKNRMSFSLAVKFAKFSQEIQKKIWESEFEHKEEHEAIRLDTSDFETYLGNLSNVAFDLNDSTLVTKCGACVGCTFNTATASLFPEDEKSPRCTNIDCFDKKVNAHFSRELEAAISNPEIVLVSESYYIDKSHSARKIAEKSKVKIFERNEFNKMELPQKPDITSFEERLDDGDFKDKDTMLAAFNEEFKEYEEELSAKESELKQSNYLKALVVTGDRAGKYIYITLNKSSNKSVSKSKDDKQANVSEKVKTAELQSEIARLKGREARAKELDQEKVYPVIYEKLNEDTIFKKSTEPLNQNELISFILLLSSSHSYDEFFLKTLGIKRIAGEMELLMILKSQSTTELKKYINQLARLEILKQSKPGDNIRFDNNARAATLKEIARQYNESFVDETINAQASIAKEREDRVNVKIKKIEGQLPESKPAPVKNKVQEPKAGKVKEKPKKKVAKKKSVKKKSNKKSAKKK